MCVFVSRPLKIVTFLRKNGDLPNWLFFFFLFFFFVFTSFFHVSCFSFSFFYFFFFPFFFFFFSSFFFFLFFLFSFSFLFLFLFPFLLPFLPFLPFLLFSFSYSFSFLLFFFFLFFFLSLFFSDAQSLFFGINCFTISLWSSRPKIFFDPFSVEASFASFPFFFYLLILFVFLFLCFFFSFLSFFLLFFVFPIYDCLFFVRFPFFFKKILLFPVVRADATTHKKSSRRPVLKKDVFLLSKMVFGHRWKGSDVRSGHLRVVFYNLSFFFSIFVSSLKNVSSFDSFLNPTQTRFVAGISIIFLLFPPWSVLQGDVVS